MSDDMPELIDVTEESAPSQTVPESKPVEEKKEEEFKMIVSKRKRRQQKMEAEAAEEVEDDDDDDYEIEQHVVGDDEEPDNLKMQEQSDKVFDDANRKFKFPPISGDKLTVCFTVLVVISFKKTQSNFEFIFKEGKQEARKIFVPPNRFNPLKENWMKIYTPIVDYLKLQVRFNLKTRNIELKVIIK